MILILEKTYDVNKSICGNRRTGVEVDKLEVKMQGYTALAISDIGL